MPRRQTRCRLTRSDALLPSRSLNASWPQSFNVSAAIAGVRRQPAKACRTRDARTDDCVGAATTIRALRPVSQQGDGDGEALEVDGIDQRTRGQLEDQRRGSADAEREADIDLAPALLG